MSRARRILDLLGPPVPPQNDRSFEFTDTFLETHTSRKRKRESSPLPAGFEEELIQLQDLIGDIFSNSEKSLDVPDIVNPSDVNPVIQPKTPSPSATVPDDEVPRDSITQ